MKRCDVEITSMADTLNVQPRSPVGYEFVQGLGWDKGACHSPQGHVMGQGLSTRDAVASIVAQALDHGLSFAVYQL